MQVCGPPGAAAAPDCFPLRGSAPGGFSQRCCCSLELLRRSSINVATEVLFVRIYSYQGAVPEVFGCVVSGVVFERCCS